MSPTCCSIGSDLWPTPCSKTFFKFSVDRSVSLVILINLETRHTSNGWVAQLVEQRTENPRVRGSIPFPATLN